MPNGQRIKQARKANQLSQRGLADRVGISAMAISKYERDMDVPGSVILLRLAQSLGVSIDFFFRPMPPEVQLQAYRKHASLRVKDQEAIQARIQEWLERYLEVESFFVSEELRPTVPKMVIAAPEELETAAEELRVIWNLGLDPIENLIQLLEDQGIKVGLVEGFDHFDACTFMANGIPVIVTKENLSGDRQRFNLGHELGHLVLDVSGNLDIEKSAHRFVGAFLAPAPAVRYELGAKRSTLDMNELYLLKHKYGLSMQAWIFRASDLGIISPSAAKRLFYQFRIKGWHKKEPGAEYPSEEPVRMERLIYRALVEDLISRSKAQELLGKPLQNSWAPEIG
jgi:Zn-dependent peptidase ImmA (M78 family)/DNA-binding XRE family transcriptional regulator